MTRLSMKLLEFLQGGVPLLSHHQHDLCLLGSLLLGPHVQGEEGTPL